MTLNDYLRRQRDLERILERTEFSSFRSIDSEIRKLQRPIHESLADSVLGSVVRDAERMRALSSDIYSSLQLSSVAADRCDT